MNNLFNIVNLENFTRLENLDYSAKSQIKSTKNFPIFIINGKKKIFKPLSKTKPYTTPLFAYSEVYWSYIFNKYFDRETPRYFLASFPPIEKEQPKYYSKGVIVESITPNDEKLINLYDYFIEHPDSNLNIKDYINYCMKNYDYTKVLQTNIFKTNKEFGEYLAYQILLSILRQDQNFHYENINFINQDNNISLAPPIDFEFSTPFLYPDNPEECYYYRKNYLKALNIKYEEDQVTYLLKLNGGFPLISTLRKNVCYIVKNYPQVVFKFITNLDQLIDDLPYIILTDPNNFIGSLNTNYWEVGHALYKDNDTIKYNELKNKIKLIEIDKEETFKRISNNILEFSKQLSFMLKIYLISYYNGIEDLELLTIKDLLSKLNISEEFTIEDINIHSKELKLKIR